MPQVTLQNDQVLCFPYPERIQVMDEKQEFPEFPNPEFPKSEAIPWTFFPQIYSSYLKNIYI